MVINDQDSAILKNTSNVFHLNTVLTSKKTQQYKTNKEKKKKKTIDVSWEMPHIGPHASRPKASNNSVQEQQRGKIPMSTGIIQNAEAKPKRTT